MSLPFVYRVHGTPKEEKIDDFINFISLLGYKVNGKVNIKYPSSVQKLLEQLKDKKEWLLAILFLYVLQFFCIFT